MHSFHPPPSNRAGSHSKSIRNHSGRPVLGNHRRGPVAAGYNTASWWSQISEIVPETTVELAERCLLKSKSIRYSAAELHLHHTTQLPR